MSSGAFNGDARLARGHCFQLSNVWKQEHCNSIIRRGKGSAIIELGPCPHPRSISWGERNLQPPKYVFDSANNGVRDNISRSPSFVSHYDAVNSLRTTSRRRRKSSKDIYVSPARLRVPRLLGDRFFAITRRLEVLLPLNTFLELHFTREYFYIDVAT